jgi:hypothetical protein
MEMLCFLRCADFNRLAADKVVRAHTRTGMVENGFVHPPVEVGAHGLP